RDRCAARRTSEASWGAGQSTRAAGALLPGRAGAARRWSRADLLSAGAARRAGRARRGRYSPLWSARRQRAAPGRRSMRRAIRIGVLALVFAGGYLLGATTQPTAEAQMGELGKKAMEQAAGQGGALGT